MAHRRRYRLAVLLVLVVWTTSCATDEHARKEELPEPRPTYVKRTGVPFLMDLPIIGALFRHTTVVR